MSVNELVNGRYEIEEILGEGGFGAVYRARDVVLNRPVAVKRLHREVSADPAQQQRFLTEAQLTSQLGDPHIITVYDHGVDEGGQLFLVTEFLEGESLEDRLRRGPLSAAELFKYFIPLCDALQEAHELGILHRDLKPANLFIAERRGRKKIKLLDFGIAKALQGLPGVDSQQFKLTSTGHLIGSPQYLSPEQALGERQLSPATDLYSLGVTLYEALTSVRLFDGESLLELLNKIVYTPPNALSSQTATPWRLAFAPLLERLLEKDPRARLGDAGELREELERLSKRSDLECAEVPAPSAHPQKSKSVDMYEETLNQRSSFNSTSTTSRNVGNLDNNFGDTASDPNRLTQSRKLKLLIGLAGLTALAVGGWRYAVSPGAVTAPAERSAAELSSATEGPRRLPPLPATASADTRAVRSASASDAAGALDTAGAVVRDPRGAPLAASPRPAPPVAPAARGRARPRGGSPARRERRIRRQPRRVPTSRRRPS